MKVNDAKQNQDKHKDRFKEVEDLEKRLNDNGKGFEQGRSRQERQHNEKFNRIIIIFIALVLLLIVIQQVLVHR